MLIGCCTSLLLAGLLILCGMSSILSSRGWPEMGPMPGRAASRDGLRTLAMMHHRPLKGLVHLTSGAGNWAL